MPRRPRGTLVRNVPDWYCQKLFGTEISQNSVGAQASNCGVFNNSQNGTIYYVYSAHIFVSANTFVNFKLEKGKNYATYTNNTPQPIDPRIGGGSAINEAGTNAGCLGTHVGGINMLAAEPQLYAPGWPFLIVPPGYAGVIETSNLNITLQIAIYWLELRGGGF